MRRVRIIGDRVLRAYSLAELRLSLGVKQTDLARELGVSSAALCETEGRDDLRLSTVSAYVHALGGELMLVAAFEGEEGPRSYCIRMPSDQRNDAVGKPDAPPQIGKTTSRPSAERVRASWTTGSGKAV